MGKMRTYSTGRIGAGIALCLALAAPAPPAFAIDDQNDDAGKYSYLPLTSIEETTQTYDQARAVAIHLDLRAAAVQQRIETIEAKLPELKELSDEAARQQYKSKADWAQLAEVLLSSRTLDDFFKQSDYIERISRANTNALSELRDAEERVEKLRTDLNALQSEADAALQIAQEALEAEQRRRSARAANGIASAQSQAVSMGGEASVGRDGAGNEQPEDYREAAMTDTGALADGADWTMTEDEFIDAWAPRIDAYLAGSPLSGQGEAFARSSWRYCVDPRWSPAISNTESSKGTYCIRPHNAWGWGAADSDPYGLASEWGSWEEAIDAHIRGLSEGYGYTITIAGAKSYCPSTWQSWYNHTLSEMGRI